MRRVSFTLIVLALSLLMSDAASGQQRESKNQLKQMTVMAYIDGRSFLVITPTKLRWHHMDFAPPGWWGGNNFPTNLFMNQSLPNQQDVSWIPLWHCPPGNPLCHGINSSDFLLGLRLVPKYQLTGMEVIRARSSVSVYQYPGPDNAYKTIIDFNDDPPSGADWYIVKLTFAPAP